MAACGKRWGGKYRVETGPRIARARTGFALRSDHDDYNWFRTGNQERAALDREIRVQTRRLQVALREHRLDAADL